MLTLLTIHSIIRWLIVLVALVAVVKFAIGWLGGGAFKGMDRGLAAGFSGLLDLQATLGIILFVWFSTRTGFQMVRVEHAGAMLIAIILGHLPARWKNAEDKIRFRNTLFCILGALVFIYLGVSRLPVGWSLQPN
ncbi:MAG: hypothetical protein H6634_07905 [Anaerolineales bacterium]|nr:hypothetical protein [Anaerolineales bacterium]